VCVYFEFPDVIVLHDGRARLVTSTARRWVFEYSVLGDWYPIGNIPFFAELEDISLDKMLDAGLVVHIEHCRGACDA